MVARSALFMFVFLIITIIAFCGGKKVAINGVWYEMREKLGDGGGGVVYKGSKLDGNHKFKVAIKEVVFANKKYESFWREKYLQEVVVSHHFKRLTPHPVHIIRMHEGETNEQQKTAWIVMERGESDLESEWFENGLRAHYQNLLHQKQFAKGARLIEGIVLQAAKGLRELHKSFVHLDFKGNNMVFVRRSRNDVRNLPWELSKQGVLKIVDFQAAASVKMNAEGKECPHFRKFSSGRCSASAPEMSYTCNGKDTRKGIFIRNLISPANGEWKYDAFNHCGQYAQLERNIVWEASKLRGNPHRRDEYAERRQTLEAMRPLGGLRCAAKVRNFLNDAAFFNLFGLKLDPQSSRSLRRNFHRIFVVVKACVQLDPVKRPSAAEVVTYLENRRKFNEPRMISKADFNKLNRLEVTWLSAMNIVRSTLATSNVINPNYIRTLREKVIFPLTAKYAAVIEEITGVCARPDLKGC